jgi:hypothetical protein
MIEVLIAGAVLIVGLTGIVTMLLRSAGDTRDGVGSLSASSIANSAADDFISMGVGSIPIGVTDAGFVFDGQGRKYSRIVTATAGGTPNVPTVNVSVRVEWRDSNGQTRVTTSNTMTSAWVRPDAG